uniref:Uncharacterized protein n=1 Tax=Timema tahoe TaxID=61484 RepID=A0A7R9FFD3_9NEOP|nr:unnamed protein product [Timema tahoe]
MLRLAEARTVSGERLRLIEVREMIKKIAWKEREKVVPYKEMCGRIMSVYGNSNNPPRNSKIPRAMSLILDVALTGAHEPRVSKSHGLSVKVILELKSQLSGVKASEEVIARGSPGLISDPEVEETTSLDHVATDAVPKGFGQTDRRASERLSDWVAKLASERQGVLIGVSTRNDYWRQEYAGLMAPVCVSTIINQFSTGAVFNMASTAVDSRIYGVVVGVPGYEPRGPRLDTQLVPWLSVSNESLVVLRKVGFNLSGNFSCEVTVDAPSFSTKTVQQQLLVVALPEGPPELHTDRERYDPGDILRANCTSPPSKPAASITFLLNDVPFSIT